jgi:hypothetical protein
VYAEKNEGHMCARKGSGFGQGKNQEELDKLIEALEGVMASLDAAGENIAAAHVDMALHVLRSRKS